MDAKLLSLTKPQLLAFKIIAEAPEDKLVEGHKRSSMEFPVRRVNIKAVGQLVRLKLVRVHLRDSRLWSPYTHDERYSLTDLGREIWEQLNAR